MDARLIDELTATVLHGAALATSMADDTAPRVKADGSPVTAVDEAVEVALVERLACVLPGVAVVSEEAGVAAAPPLGGTFLLLDPIDGTRELIAGRDEYTINLALVQDGSPILGIISAPARGTLWRGGNGLAERLVVAAGAHPCDARERQAIRTRQRPPCRPVAVVSRSHLDPQTRALLAALPEPEIAQSGAALKFCRVAEGSADIYPRLAPTREWDDAAGHAILTAAGGVVVTPAGKPLRYGRAADDFLVPGFIALGDPRWVSELCGIVGR